MNIFFHPVMKHNIIEYFGIDKYVIKIMSSYEAYAFF